MKRSRRDRASARSRTPSVGEQIFAPLPQKRLGGVKQTVPDPVPTVKRLGGVKVVPAIPVRLGDVKAVLAIPVRLGDQRSVKKLGGVKAPVPRGTGPRPAGSVESCPQNCPGEYVEGCWIHSRDCPWSTVLWKDHGFGPADWRCPYACPPVELPNGWTHQHDCRFWDRTGRTPFDHVKAPS